MKNTTKGNKNIKHHLKINVPNHWQVVLLEEVLEKIIGGGTPSKSKPEYWTGKIPWLTVKDMRTTRPSDAIDHISELGITESATNLIPADTVIIATRIGLGKVIRVPFDSAINQDLKALMSHPEIEKSYLELWLLSISNYLQSIGSGTTVKGIRLEQLKSLPFPLAPQGEQKRIVAEIEKQFSRLDEAVENLQRVKANLKRYKAAVLKAAVEGKLTEEWRKLNPDVEPASRLLERILIERRTKLEEAELAKMKANGKVPKDDKWRKKYKEPWKPEADNCPQLPEGWAWASLDQLTQYVSSGSRGWAKYYSENGDLFIRAQNIKRDKLDLDELAFVTLPDKVEGQRTLIQQNDILITITGANVTKTALVIKDLPQKAYVNQHIALTRPVAVEMAGYLYLWIICPSLGRRILEKAAYGAGKPGLNLTNIRELQVAIPPIEEQEQIAKEVQRIGSLINDLSELTNINRLRSQKLRQSILQKAFSGELVKPDLDDEPASVLVERIEMEQKKKQTARRKKKARNRTTVNKPICVN